MPQELETFVVRFANRAAVQRLQEAKELVKEALDNLPWSEELRRATVCLDEAWDGLTFGREG